MCGIAGWATEQGGRLARADLERMLAALAHRGPDDQGLRAFGRAGGGRQVFLGHRRLAIIDPQGARQPMCDGSHKRLPV